MNTSESLRIVALLTAYFPRQNLGDATSALWARSLEPYEFADAAEAASVLGPSSRWFPSLREFVDGIEECRNVRVSRTPKLPEPGDPTRWPGEFCTLEEFLRDHPEYRVRVRNLGVWGETLRRIEAETS